MCSLLVTHDLLGPGLAAPQPVRGLGVEEAGDEAPGDRVLVPPPLQPALHDLLVQLHEAGGREGRLPHQHLVDQHAQGPPVNLAIHGDINLLKLPGTLSTHQFAPKHIILLSPLTYKNIFL